MDQLKPSEISASLTDARLGIIARRMLDVLDDALQTASTPLDCAYSRGTLAWARIRNALILLAESRQYPWLSVKYGGNDLVLGIGPEAVRFFVDDHENPKKIRVLSPTNAENIQLELFKDDAHSEILWRFIIEKAVSDEADHQVFFVGYEAHAVNSGNLLALWRYQDQSVRTFTAVDSYVPPAAMLQPIELAPIDEETAQGDKNEAVNDTGSNI